MNLTKDLIHSLASKEYDHTKGRVHMIVNGHQYWFREVASGWEFCGQSVETLGDVLDIIHKGGVIIGEGNMLAKAEENIQSLQHYYHKSIADWAAKNK